MEIHSFEFTISIFLGQVHAEMLHFHEEIKRAVITCPASFGPLERDKIREAAQQAGFMQVELLEEPVAAAIAYVQMGLRVGRYILVYDLGGGTFDLAVLVHEEDGTFHPALEPQGIKRCGGDDFDTALYNYCDQIAKEKLNRPISMNGKRDLHFLNLCRQRKENLSLRSHVMMRELLEPGAVLFEQDIDRATFERLIQPTLEETVRKTKTLLEEAKAQDYVVDTLVLMGGSTRVPLAQQLLEQNLPLKPQQSQLRDVAVALGAAYYAQSIWYSTEQFDQEVPEAQEKQVDKQQEQIDLDLAAEIQQLISAQNNNPQNRAEQHDQSAQSDTRQQTVPAAVETKDITRVLKSFASQADLHLTPEIPTDKLAHARANCAISEEEPVLGLVDCTFWGSAKNCVLFGSKAIYHHVDGTRGKIAYKDFPNSIFVWWGNTVVALGNANGEKIHTANSAVSAEKLCNMFTDIKHLFAGKEQTVSVAFRPSYILQILRSFEPQADLHLFLTIPSDKLTNAKTKYKLFEQENILALIDCTVLGSAKDSVIFSSEAIYHHNWAGGHGRIPYSQLSRLSFSVKGSSVFTNEGEELNVAGSAVSAEKLLQMLGAIQQLLVAMHI